MLQIPKNVDIISTRVAKLPTDVAFLLAETNNMQLVEIDGFLQPELLKHGDVELPFYCSKVGTIPLIVLHELPGMSETFIAYCRRMSNEGYRVYMPLMFKSPMTNMNPLQCGLFCISAEFRALFAAIENQNLSRPFTKWLLGFVELISARHPGDKIGVVGMCLTGNFALAAIAKPNINAAVSCQSSFPFFLNISSLGLSAQERKDAARRARTLPTPCAKGYRFKNDWICRRQHMEAIERTFSGSFERYPDLVGCSHSTLTSRSANEQVYNDVLNFLNARLM